MDETKKSMPVVGQAILIYICSGILGLLISGVFGKLYRYIIGPYLGDSVFVIGGEELDNLLGGMTFGYLFFMGLFTGFWVRKKVLFIWLVGFVLVGWTSFWSIKDFGASILIALLGLLLGQLIRWVLRVVAKKPTTPKV